jgi:hypothetical protein
MEQNVVACITTTSFHFYQLTPQYVQNTISDNSINIIGTNFSINPFVQFISDVNSQVISAQSQTYNSESSITAVISNANEGFK